MFLEQAWSFGHSDASQAVAEPCRLQPCAVLGNSGEKLSEYIYIDDTVC